MSEYRSTFANDYAPYREKIEWANYWWDEAYSCLSKRILMIGDSTSRFYRHAAAENIGLPVDFFGTSSAITDPLFAKELRMFFSVKEYKYDLIHLQLGVHGIVPENPNVLLNDYPDYYLAYERDYQNLVLYLQEQCTRLVLGTITPVVKLKGYKNPIIKRIYILLHRKSSEIIDEQFDSGIKARNSIVRKTAQKFNLPVNDLYEMMTEGEGKRFKHIDHVHYEKSSKKLFAEQLKKYYEEGN